MTPLAASSAASQVINGTLAFLVVAALGVALVFLFRSMNRHLRKVGVEPRWRKDAAAMPGESGPAATPPPPGENGAGPAAGSVS